MSEFSPLFYRAHRDARLAAKKVFAESPIGKLFDAAWGRRAPRPADVDQVINALRLWGPGPQALRGMMGMRFGNLTWTIERYAKRNDDLGDLVREWLNSLGAPGKLLLSMFGPGRMWFEPGKEAWLLQGAINFLRAYGYEVLPSPKSLKPGTPVYERAKAAAWEWLEKTGETMAAHFLGPPEVTEQDLFQEIFTPRSGRVEGGEVDLSPLHGIVGLPPDHPINTGKFVEVQSSNVHSVAYDARDSTLFVRFWQKKWDKDLQDYVPSGPGPIYAYSYVPPQMFVDLLESRSKGGWVWDNLRIRGTVSGHRFDYRLVAIAGGYVPRKATFAPLKPGDYSGEYGEVFIPRLVQTPRGKWLQSVKPYEVARTFRPTGPIPPRMAELFGVGVID